VKLVERNTTERKTMTPAERQALKSAISESSAYKAHLASNPGDYSASWSTAKLQQLALEWNISPKAIADEVIQAAYNALEEAPKAAAIVAAHSIPASDTTGAAAKLAALIGELAGQALNPAQISAMIDEKIKAALASVPSVRLEVKSADGVIRNVDCHQHPLFKRLLTACMSRQANGVQPNIWLAGPAGSGKTHACHMVADALGIAFHSNGALSQPYELLGFIDAGGAYHRTPFREAYEHGGVYCFDEVDGSDNSALLALNAALANGSATFPDATVKRHSDTVIIGTANTFGLGATADYVGRAKIDGAFLDRFPVKFSWGYDTALEINISGNEIWAKRVIAARQRAQVAGLKVIISPRSSIAGAALLVQGWTEDEVAEFTYLASLSKEQRKQVEGA
jgi:cobaltochelatase CobS